MTGMMTSKYNNNKKNQPLVEGEERELQFQGQPGLHKKFKANLSYTVSAM